MCSNMRAHPKRFLKAAFWLGIALFLIGNMHILFGGGGMKGVELTQTDTMYQPHDLKDTGLVQEELKNLTHILKPPDHLGSVKSVESNKEENSSTYQRPVDLDDTNVSSLLSTITKINQEQRILNLPSHPLSMHGDSVVLVVQVHNRLDYLKLLIRSLRAVADIQSVLVIFSHDYYSPELNAAVREIEFCPVMQIFYPFSMQIFPNKFPGSDPRDCPRDIKKSDAQTMGCINADHPDRYGHYREAKYTQTKHHWFWKLNHVFGHLRIMKNYPGLLVLLEEDHYLSPDFLHMLRITKNLKDSECKDCSIITMGNYDKTVTYAAGVSSKVMVEYWLSTRHNMGMAFTRQFWQQIVTCAQSFCSYDDYNWDWSLQYIGMVCLPEKLKVMASKSARVFHMGECGLHFKGKNCDPSQKLNLIETVLRGSKQHLFPRSASVGVYGRSAPRMPKPNGGWGDVRDQRLCMSFVPQQ